MLSMTTYDSWEESVKALEVRTGPPNESQQFALKAAGIVLNGTEPQSVVAVILKSRHDFRRTGHHREPATPAQWGELEQLHSPAMDSAVALTRAIAAAWLAHHRALLDLAQLRRLQLRAGEPVVVRVPFLDPKTNQPRVRVLHEVVASIRHDGYVNFKGGNGKYAWAHDIERDTAP
jgi:hypothetical protein